MRRVLAAAAVVGLISVAGAIAAGCNGTTEPGDDALPGGSVTISHTVLGTNQSAEATAAFFSDFTSTNPNDDPSGNPYADIPIGDCVDNLLTGTPTITYLDAGTVALQGPVTIPLVKTATNGIITYGGSPSSTAFPFESLFDLVLGGSAEVTAGTYPQALAAADSLSFTAPAGINTGALTFPGGAALDVTYGAVTSEILIVQFAGAGGAGKLCRLDPGTGAANTFTIPLDVIDAVPPSGLLLIYSFTARDLTLNGRRVGLFGTNYRFATYQRT